jgi:hypothetical protein
MASTAISAQGSTLKIENLTPGTADVVIENVVSFTGFDGEAGEIDITNLSSTAKEKLSGLKDFGSFSFEWHPDYSATGQNLVRATSGTGAQKTFQIDLPDATTIEFLGSVKNADSVNGSVDAALTGSVSIAVSGDITVTPG